MTRARRIRLKRGVVVGLLLFSQLLSATGVPASVFAGSKDLSIPFPCMHRACGCMNAEQCWRQCCCFSDRQKLAWAQEHGADAPAFVHAAAAQETPTDDDTDDDSGEESCCRKVVERTPGCEHCKKRTSTPTKKPVEPKSSGGFVLGIMALRCQGHDTFALFGGIPVVPAEPVVMSDQIPLLEALLPMTCDRGVSISFAPPSPPPRAV